MHSFHKHLLSDSCVPSTRAVTHTLPKKCQKCKAGQTLLINVLRAGIKKAQGTKGPQRRTSFRPSGCEREFPE